MLVDWENVQPGGKVLSTILEPMAAPPLLLTTML